MVAQIQLPNVRFFEHLGWRADGPAGRLPRRHAPADGDPAGRSPVRGVPREVPRRRLALRRRRAAARACRRTLPHGAQASPRRGERPRIAASACSARAASRKPKLGNVSSQRSSGAPSGRGSASRSSVAPQPAPSIICSSEPAMPGHRDVARGVAEAPLGDLDERLAVGRAARSAGAVVQRGEERRACRSCTGRRVANAASSTSPGRAADAAQRPRGDAGAGGRQRGRVAERQVPADDRRRRACPPPSAMPVEHRARRARGRG